MYSPLGILAVQPSTTLDKLSKDRTHVLVNRLTQALRVRLPQEQAVAPVLHQRQNLLHLVLSTSMYQLLLVESHWLVGFCMCSFRRLFRTFALPMPSIQRHFLYCHLHI